MTGHAARLLWVEIRGFRAFGTEPRRLALDAPLIVVHAGNSQGKTSLAESLEFLITGRSSRRDLLGTGGSAVTRPRSGLTCFTTAAYKDAGATVQTL